MKFLVTGVSGFVGGALSRSLLADGHDVVGVSRTPVELPLSHISADLCGLTTDHLAPYAPFDGIFHVGAKVGMWGKKNDFITTNVTGTKNLLSIAETLKVPRFVYTSSPSVIADGTNLRGVDERYPYPDHFLAHYPLSKSMAEKAVIAAHRVGFATLVLRPHLIFGPGDTNLIPTIIRKAGNGSLAVIGSGRNLSDFTFIEDCVVAHRLAMDALLTNPRAGGRPYFISQGDPFPLWEFVNLVLEKTGHPRLTRRVPTKVAYVAARLLETLSTITNREPRISRFLVEEMSTDHFFNISAARKELGFSPRYTVREALDVTFSAMPTV